VGSFSSGNGGLSVAHDDAVLLMAYGTPDTLADVEPYFTHIRGGRVPPAAAVENLKARYERVGGGTPLRKITESVRSKLADFFATARVQRRVYMGMRHWHPYISETMRQMRADGIRDVTAVALAPHYSKLSIGAYRKAVEDANQELGEPFHLKFVDSWHSLPAFIRMMAQLVREGLQKFPEDERASVRVVFSAHSLPVRIRDWNDPYERELQESSSLVAKEAGLEQWSFAWQSAGGSTEPWLGPDILDYLDELKREGVKNVLQVPIGFVSDHLEVLYDIDVEAKEKAASLGMRLERTRLPNDSPELIKVLIEAVRSAES
jgi:protoporphyrin/coproporphyrin ferrochelatase